MSASRASKNFKASSLRITIVIDRNQALHRAILTEGTSNYREVRRVLPLDTWIGSAGRMEQPADRHLFTEHVEPLHRVFSLQDFNLNVILGQKLQGFGTDFQPLPDSY